MYIQHYINTGIDDGERLAATGIVWHVYERAWEVIFTGSLSWKHVERRSKSRSHKIVLSGPHFIFVRNANLMGTAIRWEDICKFHCQHFFSRGVPASTVDKNTLAKEIALTDSFLSDVKNPRIWSDVRLVSFPQRRHRGGSDEKVEHQDADVMSLPLKRSRRIQELEKKTATAKKERDRQQQELRNKEARNLQQQLRRDTKNMVKAMVREEFAVFMNTKLNAKMTKLMNQTSRKIQKLQKKTNAMQETVALVTDLDTQLEDLRNELTDRHDTQQVRIVPVASLLSESHTVTFIFHFTGATRPPS